jgi:hypothetical protein
MKFNRNKSLLIFIPLLVLLLILISFLFHSLASLPSLHSLHSMTSISSMPSRKTPYNLPKTIWLFWDTEEKPAMIEQIIEYNKKRFNGWNVQFLNGHTVYNFIPAAEFPKKYNELQIQHKSDWIRLYLLHNYGGCWMDAGIIVNDYQALNDIWQDSIMKQSVFTGFATGQRTYTHSSGKTMPLVIDNWFIMAPQKSKIIQLWFQEYTSAIDMGFLNYKKKMIREGVNIHAIHSNGPDDVYLTQHMCIQKVFQKDLKTLPSILLLHSNDSMFKIQRDCKWKNECIENRLLNDPEIKKLPYIKLIGNNRKLDLTNYFNS